MAEASTSRNRDRMTTLVVVLLLTLVGAGAGFAVGTLLGDSDTTDPSGAAASQHSEQAVAQGEGTGEAEDNQSALDTGDQEDIPSEDMKIMPFPPVLTTLAEPKGKWIRLEGSLLIAVAGDQSPELLAEQAGEQILTYLRSVKLSQLESPSGVLGLRDDLDDTVKTLSGGKVHGVLIHGLVVE